ncbi:MAG TPA: GAF domain-containing sensor histidine kinase [Patescibacteria group bacterium]
MLTLHRSAIRLMEQQTLDDVCRVAIDEGCRIFGAKYGIIFWWVRDSLRRIHAVMPYEESAVPRKNGHIETVFKTRKPKTLTISELTNIHPEFAETKAKASIILPLSLSNKSVGVMSLLTKNPIDMDQLTHEKTRLFTTIVALAIRNVQLYQDKKEALHQRELFVSLAGHELKTPMTVIVTTLHLLERQKRLGKKIDPLWMEKMHRNVHRLKVIVDDFFFSDLISTGKFQLNLRPIEMEVFLSKIVEEMDSIHTQPFTFINRIKKPQEMVLDEEKMVLVFNNILGNAAKYSPAKSEVKVTLEKKWHGVIITVADEGAGIHPDDLKHIFKRFFQGKNKRNGLGLGLYLSQEIVEAHGGDIEITSKLGKGTQVAVYLPLMPS